MEVHNRKYVTPAPGHFRTFKVQYEDRSVRGRTRSFRTEEEANDFVANLSVDAFFRVQQIDIVNLRESS